MISGQEAADNIHDKLTQQADLLHVAMMCNADCPTLKSTEECMKIAESLAKSAFAVYEMLEVARDIMEATIRGRS